MRRVSNTLVAALAAFLLAVGLVACGGDSSDSTSADAGQGQAESTSGDSAKSAADGEESEDGETQSGKDSGEANDFAPKPHSDSGGGSQQFQVKGGDNSIQEYGEEADTAEFDDAAASLHYFLDAKAEGNWAAACEYVSQAIVESFERLAGQVKQLKDAGCAVMLEKLMNPAARSLMEEEAEKANVRSLRVEGERAFIIYTTAGDTVLAMPLANEDGVWKVSSLAGSSLG